MIKPVTAAHIIPDAGHAVIVLMHVTILLPFLEKEFVGFLGELARDFRVVIIAQPKVYKIIHWPPYSPAPIVLIVKGRIIPCDGGNNPLTPELFRVQQVVLNHYLSLLRRRCLSQQRIKISRRETRTDLACV